MPWKDKHVEQIKKKEYYIANKEKILAKKHIAWDKKGSSIKIGDIFYKLTVIDSSRSYISTGSTGKISSRKRWKVRCTCNNIFDTDGTKLRRGDVVMCRSCASSLRPQSVMYYTQIERAFSKTIIHRAKEARIDVAITVQEFETLATKNCFYCDSKPREISYLQTRGIKTILNGIDRIDCNKGYILNNCVPCCKQCNTAKMNYSQKDFFNMVKKIYEKHSLANF